MGEIWTCNEKRRGLCGERSDAFGRTGDEEERQAKATMEGQNQGGREQSLS